MSANADRHKVKELRGPNCNAQDGNGSVNDGVSGREQRPVEENELKVNGLTRNAEDGRNPTVQAQDIVQIQQQQQPQGSMVCWERFLHLRSLKVLLVENDDSTRHLVTALLRNCSYEVIAAANGLHAWKVLEDLTNHIDLVLTEVVMPCLSGIGLLCKIMSHKTRKNIPVIMMSSHDSMGLVFKCLSKGAVDFLVKPIRKNELKNLWQHVWRRCHSSSGSGSESGTQTQKSVKSKSVQKSDNNTGSNEEEEDNESIGFNIGDGSDDGSGTQSSWTKQAIEVESPRPVSASAWDQKRERPDSTCAQVVHSNADAFGNNVPPVLTAECQVQKKQLETVSVGRVELGVHINLDLQLELSAEHPTKLANRQQNIMLEIGSNGFNEQFNEQTNVTGLATNLKDSKLDVTVFEAPTSNPKIDIKNKDVTDSGEFPSLELGLKRLRGVQTTGKADQDERNVLRRSDSSAFSRYNAGSNSNKTRTGNAGSNSSPVLGLEVTNQENMQDIRSHSSGNPPNQCSNGDSNNIDMGSTTNNAFSKSIVTNNKSAMASTVNCLNPLAQPIKNDSLSVPQQADTINNGTITTIQTQSNCVHGESQIQQLCHPYDHTHLLAQNNQQMSSERNDFSLKKISAATHCGSSNVLNGPVEGNAANYSVNGSASGSNHGSNGQNGSSTAVNAGGLNMESDNGIGRKSRSGDASGSGSGSGNEVDQDKVSQREAALTKFRQKRKERCFHKKVRYQGRKKLAEQRPRVRGQFVRQNTSENTSNVGDG
ncbi:two-component response regulator-like APRR7 isoform X2 [Cucurbita moschata]|uniref:Two-component response regulator-like APRR7 isoform X2 n=1 Tax=Cucurbita moschata TaxID=3662 RepID=A0A6J1HET9_CUCMO|nr:two-component response regulator-like APRR7 isoform X2 [Cucurbita moschata]